MLYAYLWLKSWLEAEEGQDVIEYVLILGLISIVAVTIMITVGGNVVTVWTAVSNAMTAAVSAL